MMLNPNFEIGLSIAATLFELTEQCLFMLLLNEDTGVSSGEGHKTIEAKSKLQEIEKHISYASYGFSDSSVLQWMAAAQLDAFCLEDQIAMYSNRDFSNRELYTMKRAIGMFSVDKLIKKIQTHIDKMPIDLQIMAMVSDNLYSHPITAGKILGMEDETNQVVSFLESRDDRKVLFITGGEGSGKTTLMDHLCAIYGAKKKFKIFSRVNVSETIGLVGFLKAVMEGSTADLEPDATDEFNILKKIQETFTAENNQENSYLIVLDDVQDISILQSLMHILKDSVGKIIVLTRRRGIVDGQYEEVRIGPLSEESSRRLLMIAASPEDANTATEGDRNVMAPPSSLPPTMVDTLLSKCQGNPRNIWTAGKLLTGYGLVDDWRGIVERIGGILIRRDDHDPPINSMEDIECDPPVKLLEDAKSPGDIRRAFLYCLAFPEISEIQDNAGIPKRKLIRLWMAEGFVQDGPHQSHEQAAEYLLEELVKRRLLEVARKSSVDGQVLKFRVNRHIRRLAVHICESQKVCQFLPPSSSSSEASSATFRRAETSPASPSLNFLPLCLGRRKKALSARYRMLAVHGDEGVKTASTALIKDIRLRSLLYFRTGTQERQKLQLSFKGRYKLLRTLELQGAHLDHLPSSIANLVGLRYLGLRGTALEYLPKSLQRLKHLMCLDVRDTNITALEDVSAFREMRHLLLAKSFRDRSVHIVHGLKFLGHLQTLSGAKQGRPTTDLESLKFLRKLSIKKAPSASSQDICRSVSSKEFLRSLAITTDNDGAPFDVRSLKFGTSLRKLKLGGDMGEICDRRLSMMRSITHLYLWDSNLQVDPIRTLQGLRHLLLVSLCNAYSGTKLCCTSGYIKLKKLSIISMEGLTECTFAPEAMNKLEELVFAKCGKLQSPPARLNQIQSIREVYLAQMQPQFYNEMKESVGGQKVKIVEVVFRSGSGAATEARRRATATDPMAPLATQGTQIPDEEPNSASAATEEISIIEGR